MRRPVRKDLQVGDQRPRLLTRNFPQRRQVASEARKRTSRGTYPDVSLKQVRQRCAQARQLLAERSIPASTEKAQKAAREERSANSFEVVALGMVHQKRRSEPTGTEHLSLDRRQADCCRYRS